MIKEKNKLAISFLAGFIIATIVLLLARQIIVRNTVHNLRGSIAVVSAIIERIHNGETEILVQTRWKPKRDPVYSGTLEIPAGVLFKYGRNVTIYEALKREVFSETGLRVIKIKPDIKTKIHSPKNDGAFAFLPFSGQQQIKGGQPYIGFVFICEVENKEPTPEPTEVKNIRWIKKSELRKIVKETPEKIFTLQLGVLDFYLNYGKIYTPILR